MLPMSDGLAVPANGDVKLRMGGYHVMLMEQAKELKAGEEVTVTLNFSNGESVDYTAPVKMIAMDDEVYGAFGDHQIRNELKLTPSKAKSLLGKQVCDWIYDNYRWFYEQFKYSK